MILLTLTCRTAGELPSESLNFCPEPLRIARTLLRVLPAARRTAPVLLRSPRQTPWRVSVPSQKIFCKGTQNIFSATPENAHAGLGRRDPRMASPGVSRSTSEIRDQKEILSDGNHKHSSAERVHQHDPSRRLHRCHETDARGKRRFHPHRSAVSRELSRPAGRIMWCS